MMTAQAGWRAMKLFMLAPRRGVGRQRWGGQHSTPYA